MNTFKLGVVGVGLACLLLVGCSQSTGGSNRPKTIPVKVTVKYKGQPVEGAIVTFKPKSSNGKGASGITDASGVAKLTTFTAGDGCIPGSYEVTIVKYEKSQQSASGGVSEKDYEQAMSQVEESRETPAPKNLLPKKYASPKTSGLTAEVSESQHDFTFELTD